MRPRRGRQSPCGYSYNDILHRGSGQVYVLGLLVACRSTGARKNGFLARDLLPSAGQLRWVLLPTTITHQTGRADEISTYTHSGGSSSPTSRCRPLSTNIESIYCNLRPVLLGSDLGGRRVGTSSSIRTILKDQRRRGCGARANNFFQTLGLLH